MPNYELKMEKLKVRIENYRDVLSSFRHVFSIHP